MATTLTIRPTSTVQVGSGNSVTGGGGVAHTALSDNSDASYVTLAGRSRNEPQVCWVGFTAPSLPAGSKISSVKLRRKEQTALTSVTRPRCNHWFRTLGDQLDGIGGAVQTTVAPVIKEFFAHDLPTSATTVVWTTTDVAEFPRGPGGIEWDPAGNLAAFSYQMGRDDTSATVLRVAEVYLDIVYQQASVVDVTAPTGTVTTTCRPTVTWTYTSPDSEPQEAYRVAIYTAAQTGAVGFAPFVTTPTIDSGWQLGEALAWTLDTDIVNGVWHAYVQARAKYDGPAEFTTNTDSVSWTQSITGAPNATLQSAVHDVTANHVRLTFLPSNSSPTTHAYAVQAQRGTGLWGPVRGGLLTPANGMAPIVLDDHEHELNVVNRYRVLAYGTSGAVLVPAAAYSAELTVTPASDRWWLVDPQNPLDKIPLPVMPKGDTMTFEQVMGEFKPIGGRGVRPKFVVRGPTYLPDGQLTLMFSIEDSGDEYWATFQRMRAGGRTLLLQKQHGENLYVALGAGEPMKLEYYSRGGRLVQYRKVTVNYVSTSAPAVTE